MGILTINNKQGSKVASGAASFRPTYDRSRVSAPFTSSVSPIANQAELHSSAIKAEIDAEDSVVTFDLDETLISCNRLNKPLISKGQSLGYQLRKSNAGREFFLRPGAPELLKGLKERGYKVLVSSRSHEEYAKDIVGSCALGEYVDAVAGQEQLLDRRNQDFKNYPRHSNKIGFWKRLKGHLKRWFIRMPKALFRWIRSLFNKHVVPFVPIAPGRLNKYPPLLTKIINGNNTNPGHWLIDNEYEENKAYAQKSQDYAVCDPGTFLGDKETKKNSQGEYIWAANIQKALAKGWQQHYRDTFNKDPVTA